MRKRYEEPIMDRLTMVPEAPIGVAPEEIDPLSLGWENEGTV